MIFRERHIRATSSACPGYTYPINIQILGIIRCFQKSTAVVRPPWNGILHSLQQTGCIVQLILSIYKATHRIDGFNPHLHISLDGPEVILLLRLRITLVLPSLTTISSKEKHRSV